MYCSHSVLHPRVSERAERPLEIVCLVSQSVARNVTSEVISSRYGSEKVDDCVTEALIGPGHPCCGNNKNNVFSSGSGGPAAANASQSEGSWRRGDHSSQVQTRRRSERALLLWSCERYIGQSDETNSEGGWDGSVGTDRPGTYANVASLPPSLCH